MNARDWMAEWKATDYRDRNWLMNTLHGLRFGDLPQSQRNLRLEERGRAVRLAINVLAGWDGYSLALEEDKVIVEPKVDEPGDFPPLTKESCELSEMRERVKALERREKEILEWTRRREEEIIEWLGELYLPAERESIQASFRMRFPK